MNTEKENNTKLDEALDIFIDGAGKISSALLGMVNKVGGQIYALLFLSSEPMSLDEIADRLHISKSNISINIRLLEEMNLVKKSWVKGSRKDYYVAERIYPKKVIRDFLEKIQRTMRDAITTIERTREEVAGTKSKCRGSDKERADFMLNQLTLIGAFYYSASDYFENFFSGKDVDVDLLRRVILNPEDIANKKS